jgi:hypothetical protein
MADDLCTCGSGKIYKECHGVSSPPAPHLAPTFAVQKITETQVPPEVLWEFHEIQLLEQERVKKFGQVRPEISGDFHGYKFVAVGSKLIYLPSDKCKFFTDLLIAYVPQTFGREWFAQEIAKPADERHPVMQWRVKGMTFMNAQPPLADGIYGAKPTGPLLAYLTFAYDLYIVEHNGKLDPRLMERLKRADQFQGARHELFAEATCLRGGFDIQHEDETDGSRRHVEFTATHKITGQKISVEAKSKHRPGVLGQAGTQEPHDALDLPFGKLLNNAVAKHPEYPLVVFLDMNMPFQSAERFLSPRPPHPFIMKTLTRMRKAHNGKDPINLLVITNHPQHYTKDEEIAQGGHLLSILSSLPMMAPQRQDSFFELHKAANLYGNIPQELSTDFRATGTGAPRTVESSAARPEVKFGFIPLTDPRLTPEMKAKFLQVGQLASWELRDSSGTYTGLIVIGEKAVPQGFQSMADITMDIPAKKPPMAKVQEISQIVQRAFVARTIVGIKEP